MISVRDNNTVFCGKKSTPARVSLGVPQGSVLGPILFLLYINGISNIFLESKALVFADDMTIYFTGPNPTQLAHNANNELNKLYQ